MPHIIFFGTSEFATPSLKALIDDPRFSVIGVVTQPDRPKGRHQILSPSPIKELALSEKIFDIQQPEKIRKKLASDQSDYDDFQKWILSTGKTADIFVIASYGKILPQWLLDIPKHGCINVHGSLLPRWRGASPIQSAIAEGDKTTGVTIMLVDAELDHGAILSKKETEIGSTETGGQLHDRLAQTGAEILPDSIEGYLKEIISPKEQDHAKATFCRTLKREDGEIDWNRNCHEIERKIRAYDPWPGAWTEVDGKRVKLLSSRVRPNDSSYAPGEKFVYNGHPSVKCDHNTVLEITKVQPEGKTPMAGDEFTKGNKWA
ncbi:MAG: methionyl-tRNA formyltransferase [bacterium]|nr:methionyl-tRNA formyltransferase [bacterium]